MNFPDGIVISFLSIVMGTLGACVRHLYARQTKLYDATEVAKAKCEEDRSGLFRRVGELEDRLDECPLETCPNRPAPRVIRISTMQPPHAPQ